MIPAPQALIRFKRPEELEPIRSGRVVSSVSGNNTQWLNRVASILHSVDKQPDYSVTLVVIKETDTGFEASKDDSTKRVVRAKAFGPLTILSLLGSAMSIGLIITSAALNDGRSLIATLCISLLSCLIGIGSKWELKLPERRADRRVPRSDVIIKYPNGAFVVVKCSEEIQRRLYWHPEGCDYLVSEQWYRLIALTCTLLLMAGVIFLGNASTALQLAWVAAYVILHAAYWVVAALPARLHWDLSAFDARTVAFRRAGSITKTLHPTFTQALWEAIALTRSSAWARDFDIAPKSGVWDRWLKEAEVAALKRTEDEDDRSKPHSMTIELPAWDPALRLSSLLNEAALQQDTGEKLHV